MHEQEIKPFTIGITGTDGKSTVTWIIAQALEKLLPEWHIHIPGNFDLPMSEVVYDIITKKQQAENHIFVTECSSFMLYPMHEYQFTVGVWTNFAPDHLNWHTDMKQYFAAKQHLIANSQVSFVHNSI
ncbi:MAG: Mur ligase family protein [bacterium]